MLPLPIPGEASTQGLGWGTYIGMTQKKCKGEQDM